MGLKFCIGGAYFFLLKSLSIKKYRPIAKPITARAIKAHNNIFFQSHLD
jgi:hypothetical protein